MNVIEEFKALALTVRFNALCEKSKKIGDAIGNVPLIFFPEQRKELIAIAEDELYLGGRLVEIYESNKEYDRADTMRKAVDDVKKCLYLLNA